MCGSSAGVDADTRVGHDDPRPLGGGRDIHRDRAAPRGELDRVRDEIGDHLADPLRIVADPDRRDRHPEGHRHASAGGGGARLVDCGLHRRPQVVGPEVEQDQPGVELRELKQVLGEPVESLDLLAARFEELGACLWVVGGACPRAAR